MDQGSILSDIESQRAREFWRWREQLCRHPLPVQSLVLIGRKRKVAPEADLAVPLSSVINPTEHF